MDDIRSQYASRIPLLREIGLSLQRETQGALDGLRHIDRVTFRVKSVERFSEKAIDPNIAPAYRDPLAEMEDQLGVRILVFFLQDIELVVTRLSDVFESVHSPSQSHSLESAEEFTYEGRRFLFRIPARSTPQTWQALRSVPTNFELQIRTLFMHAWAEPQHDLEYETAKQLPTQVRRALSLAAASARAGDGAYERLLAWYERVRQDRER